MKFWMYISCRRGMVGSPTCSPPKLDPIGQFGIPVQNFTNRSQTGAAQAALRIFSYGKRASDKIGAVVMLSTSEYTDIRIANDCTQVPPLARRVEILRLSFLFGLQRSNSVDEIGGGLTSMRNRRACYFRSLQRVAFFVAERRPDQVRRGV